MMTDFSSDPLFGSFFAKLYKKRFSLLAMFIGIILSIIIFHFYKKSQIEYKYFASEYFFKYCEADEKERHYYLDILKRKYPDHIYTSFPLFQEVSKNTDPKLLDENQNWLIENNSFVFLNHLISLSRTSDISPPKLDAKHENLLKNIIFAQKLLSNKEYAEALEVLQESLKTASSLPQGIEIQIYLMDQIQKSRSLLQQIPLSKPNV